MKELDLSELRDPGSALWWGTRRIYGTDTYSLTIEDRQSLIKALTEAREREEALIDVCHGHDEDYERVRQRALSAEADRLHWSEQCHVLDNEIDSLKAERDALKAENERLRSGLHSVSEKMDCGVNASRLIEQILKGDA